MKYYRLSNNIDEKVIGKYDQSESAHNAPQLYDIGEHKITQDFLVPEPYVHPKAKLTSYLSCVAISSNNFLILKKEFIKLLNNFKIDEFDTWKMQVHYKKSVVHDYRLFHLCKPAQEKYVNYEKSDFFAGNLADYKWVGETLKVTSHENFLSTTEVLRSQKLVLKGRKLVFDFSAATEDLFRIINIPPILGTKGYFVSETLKHAIEEAGFTGMIFEEIERAEIEVIY